MTSHSGFKWPESGPISAPDWKPTKECGNGLHGFMWGEGDGALASWDATAKWLVVSVDTASVIDLGGKVKFPRGEVVFCGDRAGATGYLLLRLPTPRRVIGAVVAAGCSGTATAGDSGTATAGYRGTATAGDRGTATAGDRGTATAGCSGTATAGYRGTATAGYRGTATAGDRGTISIAWYDPAKKKWSRSCAEVGENGIKPNVPYRVNVEGKFVEVAK